MKKGLNLGLLALSLLSSAAFGQQLVPLERYFSPARNDSFSTATAIGIASAQQSGYVYEGVEGCIFNGPVQGTAALNLYFTYQINDNFVTATPQGEASAAGYQFIRTEGFVYAQNYRGTLPLYTLYNRRTRDNAEVAQPQSVRAAQQSGYEIVRIEGYVLPPERCTR